MSVVGGEALVDLVIDLVIDPDGAVTAELGGRPFNAARTIGPLLGSDVAFLGAISRDRLGTLLHRQLLADEVDDSLVQFTELPSTLAAAELDERRSHVSLRPCGDRGIESPSTRAAGRPEHLARRNARLVREPMRRLSRRP
jgi:sugar/nucleoside kinase (ribokinase family)